MYEARYAAVHFLLFESVYVNLKRGETINYE